MSGLKLTTVPRDLYYHEVTYVRGLEAALKQISGRRADLAAISKNDYDSGYELATEMCCDIADEALTPKTQ